MCFMDSAHLSKLRVCISVFIHLCCLFSSLCLHLVFPLLSEDEMRVMKWNVERRNMLHSSLLSVDMPFLLLSEDGQHDTLRFGSESHVLDYLKQTPQRRLLEFFNLLFGFLGKTDTERSFTGSLKFIKSVCVPGFSQKCGPNCCRIIMLWSHFEG